MIFLGVAVLIVLIFTIFGVRQQLLFLFGIIASRAFLDSLPSGLEKVSGLSLLQLYSLLSFFFMILFLLFVRGSNCLLLARSTNFVLYGIVIENVISAAVNSYWNGALFILTKWVWLWVATGFFSYFVQRFGIIRVANAAFWALLYPLLNQIFTIIAGKGPNCPANICSYIGTFVHESALGAYFFFGILVTAILLKSAQSFPKRAFYFVVLVSFHIGLYLNYYRTLLFAVAVFWCVYYVLRFKLLSVGGRILFVILVVLAVCGGIYFAHEAIIVVSEDVYKLLSNPSRYFSITPDGGGRESQSIMSGRIYLLNVYLYHFLKAPLESIIVGIGPAAGMEFADVYAHNQYVGALVETGVVGMVLFVVWLLLLGRVAFRGHSNTDSNGAGTLVFSAYIALLFWSLGTMPLENMRALFLIAFIVSVSCKLGGDNRRSFHKFKELR